MTLLYHNTIRLYVIFLGKRRLLISSLISFRVPDCLSGHCCAAWEQCDPLLPSTGTAWTELTTPETKIPGFIFSHVRGLVRYYPGTLYSCHIYTFTPAKNICSLGSQSSYHRVESTVQSGNGHCPAYIPSRWKN